MVKNLFKISWNYYQTLTNYEYSIITREYTPIKDRQGKIFLEPLKGTRKYFEIKLCYERNSRDKVPLQCSVASHELYLFHVFIDLGRAMGIKIVITPEPIYGAASSRGYTISIFTFPILCSGQIILNENEVHTGHVCRKRRGERKLGISHCRRFVERNE